MTDVAPVIDAPAEADAKPDPTQLGDGGKAALDAERTARTAADKRAKAAEKELEALKKQGMTDQEKAVAEAKAEARKEALGEANDRVLRSEIRAAASGKLADPGDAPALLGDISRFIADNGEIDNKAISSAIGDLVKAKPYLAPAGRPGALPGGGAKPSEGSSIDDWIRKAAGH